MLQFATDSSSLMPQRQQVEIALEGGCQWIRLTSGDDIEAIAKTCETHGVMLVLDDDADAVDRLRIHGIHMIRWTRGEAISIREKLGPHAVIGLTFDIDADPAQLTALDVDYVTVPKPDSENYMEQYRALVAAMHAAKLEVHPVASGNFALDELRPLIATGIEGVEVNGSLLAAPLPAELIRTYIDTLTETRN